MKEKTAEIKITGKLTYSDEITISQAAKIIAFLNSDEPEVEGDAELGKSLLDSSTTNKKSLNTKKVLSPREALELSGAHKNPEKIVALAAYVLQDGGDTFKIEDVKAQFRRARETAPGNFTRDLGIAIASGWVIEDGSGEYALHNKFDDIFEGGFAFPKTTGSARVRAVKSPGSKTKSKTGKPEAFAAIDEFDSTMSGYPPYARMTFAKDRLLWVLAYMKNVKDVKSLSNKEIEWLTDHLGSGIPNSAVTSAFNGAQGPGYANRSTQDQKIRITEAGEAHLVALAKDA